MQSLCTKEKELSPPEISHTRCMPKQVAEFVTDNELNRVPRVMTTPRWLIYTPQCLRERRGTWLMYSLGVFWNKILEFVTEDLNNSMRQFVIKMLICLDPSAVLHPSEGNSIKIYKIRSNCLWYQPFDA